MMINIAQSQETFAQRSTKKNSLRSWIGTLKVINSLGKEVATTPITTSGTNSTMQLATWGGTGMYFVQIINPQGQIVDIKKIILQ